MSLTLVVLVGVLYACGTYLLLQRSLVRIVLGIAMLGHGANVLLIGAGRSGVPPLIADGSLGDLQAFADPLPQALALTAIVITFGVSAFLLALAYRSFTSVGNDDVEDDVEDAIVAGREGQS